jgi:hypothetical protein
MPANISRNALNDSDIIVCEIDFLRNLSQLFQSTSDRVKVNYILWRIVQMWTRILDDRFEDIKQVMSMNFVLSKTTLPFLCEDRTAWFVTRFSRPGLGIREKSGRRYSYKVTGVVTHFLYYDTLGITPYALWCK